MANVKFKPGYQDLGAYGMLQPIIGAGGLIVEDSGSVYNTGIPLDPPPPVLIPSGTRIQYTDGALVGYKIMIYTGLSGSNSYFNYIGSIETSNGGPFNFFIPYRISGSVNHQYMDGDVNSTPFGDAAGVWDDDASTIVPVEHMGIATNFYGNGIDLFLSAYDYTVATTFSVSDMFIEYEFLTFEAITPKLIVY